MQYVRYVKSEGYNADTELPFEIRYNFSKLIAWWEQQLTEPGSFEADRAAEVLKRVASNPILSQTFSDPAILEKNKEDIYF